MTNRHTTTRPANQLGYEFLDRTIFSIDDLCNIITKFCDDVDSPYSRNVRRAIVGRNYDSLLQMKLSPPHLYSSSSLYLGDAQINALIKKYPFWPTSARPKVNAYKTFIEAEIQCARTNAILRSSGPRPEAVQTIIRLAQAKISDILGPLPEVSELDFHFGPGAAYSIKRNTSPLDKLDGELDVTEESRIAATEYLRSCPGWKSNQLYSDSELDSQVQPLHLLKDVVGDRISTVPKTALTDRTIAIGPLVNVLMQKGYGAVIRERMKKCNNLNKNESLHKVRAQSSSVAGDLATVDLKAASDTISYGIVLELLPFDWFDALDNVRSHRYEIDGNSYEYQKFSAMGNGFTFELESLIFYALAYATCKYENLETSRISTFGDDILIPTAAYHQLESVLRFCGFNINSEKSFYYGPFRESCGGDFFLGLDVRPFYLKDDLTYRTLFLLHNFMVRKGTQFVFPQAYRFVRKLIGKRHCDFYRSSHDTFDGVVLDYSAPTASFNYIEVREQRRKVDRKKKGKWGVALVLYRNLRCKTVTETDIDWRTRKSENTDLIAKRKRFNHF